PRMQRIGDRLIVIVAVDTIELRIVRSVPSGVVVAGVAGCPCMRAGRDGGEHIVLGWADPRPGALRMAGVAGGVVVRVMWQTHVARIDHALMVLVAPDAAELLEAAPPAMARVAIGGAVGPRADREKRRMLVAGEPGVGSRAPSPREHRESIAG